MPQPGSRLTDVRPASAQPAAAVLTQHNDAGRTGANRAETRLTPANVNQHSFGKLFARDVDGQVYAQVLYVPGLDLPDGTTHNVIIVATMHNSVYLYDADDPFQQEPLWMARLGQSIELPDDNIGPPGYADIRVEVGIVSTPAIDLDSGTVYVVAASHDDAGYYHHIHALDLRSGQPRLQPVLVAASVPGNGDGNQDDTVVFRSNRQLQRAGLLLSRGYLYICFASYGDMQPYHGWVMSYRAADLQQMGVFNTTPNGQEGGIWQAGWGAAADEDGNIYVVTGNAEFEEEESNFGDTVLKLRGGDLALLDFFTPYNYQELSDRDDDLGSTGVMLVPGTNLSINGGKEGKFYVLDRSQLGHVSTRGSDDQIVQTIKAADGHIHGGPVYWSGRSGAFVYVWGENDYLKAYAMVNGRLSDLPVARSPERAPDGMPGGMISLSANGDADGIVWATHPAQGDANHFTRPGMVRAFDATNVSRELWNSRMVPDRDDVGTFAKFNAPTIANGKVYVPNFSGQIVVYGLLAG
jgi:hypothetical protein